MKSLKSTQPLILLIMFFSKNESYNIWINAVIMLYSFFLKSELLFQVPLSLSLRLLNYLCHNHLSWFVDQERLWRNASICTENMMFTLLMMKPERRLNREMMFDFQIIVLTSDTWSPSSFLLRIAHNNKGKIKAKFCCLLNLKAPHYVQQCTQWVSAVCWKMGALTEINAVVTM